MRIKSIIILFIVFLAASAPGLFAIGTNPPQISSCRVTPRAIGYPGTVTEVRTLQPYTGTAPLTHVSIDCCIAAFLDFAAENFTAAPFGDALSVQAVHGDIRFRAAFDPDFKTAFVDTVLTHPTVGFTLDSYDGMFDFDGLSGASHTNFRQSLVTVEADVADPSFFLQPFQVWFEMSSPDGVTILKEGHMVSQLDQRGSIGCVFKFNGVAPE